MGNIVTMFVLSSKGVRCLPNTLSKVYWCSGLVRSLSLMIPEVRLQQYYSGLSTPPVMHS